jgi:hypothetical protein
VKLPHRRQKPILSHAKGNGAQIRGVGKSVIRHPTSLMVLVASPGPSSGSAGRDAYAVRCGLEKKNGLTLFTPARSNQRR